ncbi:MAG TPA: helix-turn-helix transcriptional regulator [Sphingopyxis sp.]|nr:helix-turn-helix transcriptional regulator [Sphingopyxis sp.]
MARNDALDSDLYHANMARKSAKSKGIGPEQPNWFLPEWMKVKRVTQAKLARACDWTNSTMHGIYHGRTEYYREIVNLLASKLNIEPHELLMHPDRAMAIRRFEQSVKAEAIKLVHNADETVERTGTDN